jgi:hypothetical protein
MARAGGVLRLLALLAAATPAVEQAAGGGAGQLAWANTRAGQVAYDITDCPCGTVLAAYGEAQPDAVRLFERIVRPADLAVVVGSACASLPLELAGLVGSRGAVRVFDAHPRALEQTLAHNPQAASVV